MARRVLLVVSVATSLLIGACSSSDTRTGAQLAEDLDFLNDGWSGSPTAQNLCNTIPDSRSGARPEDCLRFARFLDDQGCPIGAFLFGYMTLPGEGEDPLGGSFAAGWEQVGRRYGCDITLAGFRSP